MTNYIEYKPRELNTAAWDAIIEAWENGLSDREAAFRATKACGKKITANEIRTWCQDDPELGELRANLLNDLLSSAKLTVAQDLRDPNSKERVKTAKWYLERKAADEFSTKSAVAFENAVVTLSLEDKKKALEDMTAEFFSDNGE